MSDTKKILVIAGGTYIFGAEKVTLDVIQGFKKSGYEVQVIISGWSDGQFALALEKLQVKYYKLKLGWYYISKWIWSLDSLVHYPGAVWRFLRIHQHFKDWPVYTISFRQIILLWPFFKKNIVYHVHDPNANSKQSQFFIRVINKKVKKFIAVSDFIKKDLIKCRVASEKITVIHNGVAMKSIEEVKESNVFNIGIVGQVIRRKGHHVLIEAMSLLDKKNLPINLEVVGSGDEQYIAELKEYITAHKLDFRINWRGFVSDKKQIYEGIDLVVAPTQNEEPFGLTACEANMLGKPVIAANTGGFLEIIEDGVNGFLVDAKNAVVIADKIEEIYSNPALYQELSLQAIRIANNHFSVEKMNNEIQLMMMELFN